MNYNLKIEMERINGNIVSNVEVAGMGRAGRKRVISPDFKTALKDVKTAHDELFKSLADYHKASTEPAKEVA